MEETITFSREDYEYSITQILGLGTDQPIGTGFLVAPGYVLTCAHVVLQAIGIEQSKFTDHISPPSETIKLRFPILSDDVVEAKVVAWLPYRLKGGDVAGLKLSQSAPKSAKPIPLADISVDKIKQDELSVYGFGISIGDRSDAYQTKTKVQGGRILLHKVGNSNDETIADGYSGSPVWNDRLGCVIGMIATAIIDDDNEQRSKAYAIPKSKLDQDPDYILRKLYVLSLCDLIEEHLQSLPSDEKRGFSAAIATAFNCCSSGQVLQSRESEVFRKQLFELSQLGDRGWAGVDRLTQFAVFLATMDAVSVNFYNHLKIWIQYRASNFDEIYRRASEEKRSRKIPLSSQSDEHLVIEARPDEQDDQKVIISIWEICDRKTYDRLNPPPYKAQDKIISLTDLPNFIENWIENTTTLSEPTLHFFVPRSWLSKTLDSEITQSGLTLGGQHKLVMRTDHKQSPTGPRYYKRWMEKWQNLEARMQVSAQDVCVRVDVRNKAELFKALNSAEIAILDNLNESEVENIFNFIAQKTALSIALWTRCETLCNQVNTVLKDRDNTDRPILIHELPKRVFTERTEAMGMDEENTLGKHLSLVWEDPKIVPPTMNLQFNQEAS